MKRLLWLQRSVTSNIFKLYNHIWIIYGYGSIPINTICSPGVQGFDPSPYVKSGQQHRVWHRHCSTFGELADFSYRVSKNLFSSHDGHGSFGVKSWLHYASFQQAVPASSSAAPCRSYVDLHGLPRCLPAKFWAYSLVIEELWKPPISFHGLAIQTWWFSIYVKLPKTISRICLTWYLAYAWQIQNDISTVRYSSNLRRSSPDVDIRTDLGIPASESSPESLANHSFSMLLICLNDFVLLTKLFHPQTDHGLAQIVYQWLPVLLRPDSLFPKSSTNIECKRVYDI